MSFTAAGSSGARCVLVRESFGRSVVRSVSKKLQRRWLEDWDVPSRFVVALSDVEVRSFVFLIGCLVESQRHLLAAVQGRPGAVGREFRLFRWFFLFLFSSTF